MLCKSAYKTSQAGLTSARLNIPNKLHNMLYNTHQAGLNSASLNLNIQNMLYSIQYNVLYNRDINT